MLTESGYHAGLAVYVAAALCALLLFNFWWLRGARWGTRCLFTLPLGALLLTPAYIAAGADTFAPALVVVAFQWLSAGPDAAAHALRPLGLFTGVAFGAGLLAYAVSAVLSRRGEKGGAAAS